MPAQVRDLGRALGSYFGHSGNLTVQASAHGATAGFFWLINPVGSTPILIVRKLLIQVQPAAATVFASAPRITAELMTFTGTPSGATIAAAKSDSSDAVATGSIRTATTGLTPTAGNLICGGIVPAVMTAVGASSAGAVLSLLAAPLEPGIVLRAGEGLVVRQPDAGSTSDTRKLIVDFAWTEF